MIDKTLPPLPEPAYREFFMCNPPKHAANHYFDEHMTAYGRECFNAGWHAALDAVQAEIDKMSFDAWHLTAPKPEKLPPPLERKSQAAVVDWARWASGQWPELRFLFAVPNGDKRSKVTASLLVSQGVRPGVPDLIQPTAHDGCIGLAIELKRKPNTLTSEQKIWQEALRGFGWRAVTCWSAPEAIDVLQKYVSAPKTLYGQAFADSSCPF